MCFVVFLHTRERERESKREQERVRAILRGLGAILGPFWTFFRDPYFSKSSKKPCVLWCFYTPERERERVRESKRE